MHVQNSHCTTIDDNNNTPHRLPQVQLSGPLSRTSLGASAKFEVRSPKRLAIRFEQGSVATPQLLSDVELPASLSVMGQPLDLTPLKAALEPVNQNLRGLIETVGGLAAQLPDLKVPIPQGDTAQTWLLTTYLDDNTRITRGDGGSVFVLVKDDVATSNN